MISIFKTELEEFAKLHYESILEYKNRKHTRIVNDQQIQWVKTHLKISFEELITAKPSKLETIKSDFDKLPALIKQGSPFNQAYVNLYNNNFSSTSSTLKSKGETYYAFVLVERVGIEICPYCNRNSIHNAKKIRTSELDHFFDKSTYPIFAMSFFNLVPSCKVCNQLKNDKKPKIVNPYDDRYSLNEEAFFEMKIKNVNYVHSKEGFDLKYRAKNSSIIKEEIENADGLFQLNDLYQHHKNYVLEIIQKEVVYNEDYIDDLFKQFEGTLFKNREDLLQLIGSNYVEDMNRTKRPLSKLTQDIFKQLDLK